MKPDLLLTDDLIRQALTPPASAAMPAELLEGIAARIRREPQRRGLLGLLRVGGAALGWSRIDRRVVWALALAGLILALMAGALAGALLTAERNRESIDLVPTGIDTLTDADGYARVLADGQGTSWAIGPGRVTRFDPRTGTHRTWTVSDDAVFARAGMAMYVGGNAAASRAGGVWLAAADRVVRFDGTAFRRVIPLPPGGGAVDLLAESPAGNLWAADATGALWRWDGTAWGAAPAGRPAKPISSLVVLSDDDLWVGEAAPDFRISRLWHLSGSRWESPTSDDVRVLGAPSFAVAAGSDGTFWVGSILGVARYAGGIWQLMPGPGIVPGELAAGDGVLAALERDPTAIQRFAEGAWTRLGLGGVAGEVLTISVQGSDIYIGTTAGLFRHAGAGWARVWRDAERGPTRAGVFVWPNLLAVSEDEAWYGGDDGVWHYVDGAWSGPDVPPMLGSGVRGLAVGPRGELVAVTGQAVSVRRDGRWTTAAVADYPGEAAVASDGSIWYGGGRDEAGARLVHLEESAVGWRSTAVACPAGGSHVAIGSDGAIWTAGFGYAGTPGVARYDGRSCSPVGTFEGKDVVALEAAGASVVIGVQAGSLEEANLTASAIRVGPTGAATVLATYSSWVVQELGVGPSGEVWYEAPDGLGRWDGGVWHGLGRGIPAGGDISIASDGAVWFDGLPGIQRIQPEALR